jgi:hypothetical protein
LINTIFWETPVTPVIVWLSATFFNNKSAMTLRTPALLMMTGWSLTHPTAQDFGKLCAREDFWTTYAYRINFRLMR